jgi:hypothetical protein
VSQNNSILESRNDDFKKASSVTEHNMSMKVETRNSQQQYRALNKGNPISNNKLNKSLEKPKFALNKLMFDEMMKTKKLSKMASQKRNVKMADKRIEDSYKLDNENRKSSSASMNNSTIYRHKDSRHFSHQQKPIYIANILNGGGDQRILDEIQKSQREEVKSPDYKKHEEIDLTKPALFRSPSEEKNLGNLFSHAPHGGALEKLNNEERLNFLSDANLSKIDNNSIHRRQEKSIDLDLRTGTLLDKHSTDMITNKVINNNMLSKYLTKFIGNKDYRTTEERELDKWTFRPKFINKRKFKNVKGKVAGYIKEEDSQSRTRDIAMFAASENIKSVIQSCHSVGRGLSADSRFNNSLWMSDGGFLCRTIDDETSTISVLNEMRSIPTIYSNKNVAGLGGILQFGYSHKYHERKHYKEVIKPTIRNLNRPNTTFFGSSKALSLSINDDGDRSVFQAKVLTPVKSMHGLKSQRIFTNRLRSKVVDLKNSPQQMQEPELNQYTPAQLDEIRKIHELHFKLKRGPK